MKLISISIISIAFSGCAPGNIAPDSAMENSQPNISLSAFEDVCLKTAPSFSGAKVAAAKYGIADIEDMGFSHIGMSKDQSIGVQIKPNNECVITTPPQKIPSLTRDFLQLVSRNSKTPPSTRVPTKAPINGTMFIFQHDRNDGEAFVMLKANG